RRVFRLCRQRFATRQRFTCQFGDEFPDRLVARQQEAVVLEPLVPHVLEEPADVLSTLAGDELDSVLQLVWGDGGAANLDQAFQNEVPTDATFCRLQQLCLELLALVASIEA